METQSEKSFAISCNNVPETLFENGTAVDHFSRFGIVTKITLQPKKSSCIVEYETREDADKAILNAGAYDGFMFDVKFLKKKRPKPNDDPDWLPDSEVAAELAAMARNQSQIPRLNRQQKMDIDTSSPISQPKKSLKKTGIKNLERKKTKSISKSNNTIKPVLNINKTALISLINKAWESIDDKLKALDIRDKLLRQHSKNRHGALKGCCPDMCPEKERLLRESQRQVAVYELQLKETASCRLDPKLAIKEYSRSSADQEEPLPHELRPVRVLHQTLLYLLHHIVDLSEHPEESLGDWFHFMWDRLRAIRKDITQQALCCEGSVALVEACARFHAHCAARLIKLPSSSFDQRLNTENLLKCLQSLKYMYNDLRNRGEATACVCEPEFRAYVILLNLHDANFMWEVQHLQPNIQSSPEVSFAIKIFTALDNNNYVKFFKLVNSTTYLNACILLRYFDDVRVRAIKRMIKAYSPRGVSYFPAYELMETLSFEDLNSMEKFLIHYGVQMHYNDSNLPFVAFDKSTFINNDDTFTPERAMKLVEAKRKCSLGEMIYGKPVPYYDFESYTPHSSFDENNFFKKSSILAEDQDNIPPANLVAEVKKIVDDTATNQIFESKEIPAFVTEKKFDFIFAEPKTIDDPQFASGLQTKNSISGNVSKENRFGNIPFHSLATEKSENIFGTSQFDKNKQYSDFNFKNPILVNNINHKQPEHGNHIFGSSIENNLSKPFFVPKIENNMGNILDNNILLPKSFDQTKTIFGSNLFSNYNAEKEKEKQRFEEAEKKRVAEEERIEKIQREMQIQEELRKKIEKEKAELERIKAERIKELEKTKELERKKEYERKNAEKKQFEEFSENFSNNMVLEFIDEYVTNICSDFIEECNRLNKISDYANSVLNDLCLEIAKEECMEYVNKEVKLYKIRTRLKARSVIRIWRALVMRSQKRRCLLNNTPMWLLSQPPPSALPNQSDALQRMRDFHRGKIHTFKMSNDVDIPQINIFNEVKKYLLQRSNEINTSLDIYWKIVLSLPSDVESPEYSTFYKSWTKDAFGYDQNNSDYLLHLSENYWFKRFCVSICKICNTKEFKLTNIKAIEGASGLLFYDTVDNLDTVFTRLEAVLSKKNTNILPIALILITSNNDDIILVEEHLQSYKSQNKISNFKIYDTLSTSDDSFLKNTKRALKWLALNFPSKPPLECNLLPAFLNQCIGDELIYRFKLALHTSIRGAFENIETVINIYNEAIDRTIKITFKDNFIHYPNFPSEFRKYVQKSNLYPKSYEHFSEDWSVNTNNLKHVIASFKMSQYVEKWPPSSWSSFKMSIEQYIKALDWYDNYDSVLLKVLALFNIDNEEPQNKIFCWLDVMNVLIKEKISKIQNNTEIFYNKGELEHFRTTPWWYKSVYTKNISTYIEDTDIDYLENTLEDLGINCVKKQKFDESLESIPDDEWLSQTVAHFDNSLKTISCKKSFDELEKFILERSTKQAEIDALLMSALEDT